MITEIVSKRYSNRSDTGNQNVITADEKNFPDTSGNLSEILFITSFPPRECGIATYSQDLIKALNNKFDLSFKLQICALESESEIHNYSEEIKYVLNTDIPDAFTTLAIKINNDPDIRIVLILSCAE